MYYLEEECRRVSREIDAVTNSIREMRKSPPIQEMQNEAKKRGNSRREYGIQKFPECNISPFKPVVNIPVMAEEGKIQEGRRCKGTQMGASWPKIEGTLPQGDNPVLEGI